MPNTHHSSEGRTEPTPPPMPEGLFPRAPEMPREPPRSESEVTRVTHGEASFARLRGPEEATQWNSDSIISDPRERTFGIMSSTDISPADERVRSMAMQLLMEGIRKIPATTEADPEAPARFIQEMFQDTGKAVTDTAREFEAYRGSSTPIALVHLIEDTATRAPREAIIAGWGDNRVYHIRDGLVEQLTQDQTKDNLRYVDERIPTGGIGVERGVQPVVQHLDITGGDAFVIVSRDLAQNISDTDIAILAERFSGDPNALAREIAMRGRGKSAQGQGRDGSMTAIAIRIPDVKPEAPHTPAEPESTVPQENIEAWRRMPTQSLTGIATTYTVALDTYARGIMPPENTLSRAHGIREAFRSAQTDIERQVATTRDRKYKESALEAIDAILAARVPTEIGQPANDYDVRLPEIIARPRLAMYVERLRDLQDPNTEAAVKEARGIVTRFHWPNNAHREAREECLAAERVHVRRRIAQMQESLLPRA